MHPGSNEDGFLMKLPINYQMDDKFLTGFFIGYRCTITMFHELIKRIVYLWSKEISRKSWDRQIPNGRLPPPV